MGADSSAENTPNAPEFICPICLSKLRRSGFQWKKASLGVRSLWLWSCNGFTPLCLMLELKVKLPSELQILLGLCGICPITPIKKVLHWKIGQFETNYTFPLTNSDEKTLIVRFSSLLTHLSFEEASYKGQEISEVFLHIFNSSKKWTIFFSISALAFKKWLNRKNKSTFFFGGIEDRYEENLLRFPDL